MRELASINARVEGLVDEHVNKSLEAARTKAALQAELEMASPMLPLRERSTIDLRLGQEVL